MKLFFVAIFSFSLWPAFLAEGHAQPNTPIVKSGSAATLDLPRVNYELERRRVEIEDERLKNEKRALIDAQTGAWWTRLSIIVPIVIGFATLFWQARTAYRLKELESDVAFQLKAAEVILNSKSTKAGEERARALQKLFPHRVTGEFVKAFGETNFKLPGMAYQEKKLELFKAMSSNLDNRREIFRAYAMIYADEEAILVEFIDKWGQVYPEDAAWVADFTESWKSAFPDGRWKRKISKQDERIEHLTKAQPDSNAPHINAG